LDWIVKIHYPITSATHCIPEMSTGLDPDYSKFCWIWSGSGL